MKPDHPGRRLVLAVVMTVALWALVSLVAVGVRVACPVSASGPGACDPGPVYQVLHPGPEAFNHVFGAVIFVALVVLAIASSLYLARTLWRLSR